MGYGISTAIKSSCMVAALFACFTMAGMPTFAASGDKPVPAQSKREDAQANKQFADYCEIVPRRDLRGVPLDPSMSPKQMFQFRVDSYNGTEKKLAAMRQKLMKLGHATVEKMLHEQMEIQDPEDTGNLMCVMEIVARSLPQEYGDYAKLVKPGVDQTGFVDYCRERFLGKNQALHEDLSDVMP